MEKRSQVSYQHEVILMAVWYGLLLFSAVSITVYKSVCGILFLLLILRLLIVKRWDKVQFVITVILFSACLSGLKIRPQIHQRERLYRDIHQQEVSIKGRVITVFEKWKKWRYRLVVSHIQKKGKSWQKLHYKVKAEVIVPTQIPVQQGEDLAVIGRIFCFKRKNKNPQYWKERLMYGYSLNQLAFFVKEVSKWGKPTQKRRKWVGQCQKIKGSFKRRVMEKKEDIKTRLRGFLIAILTGEREELSLWLKKVFKKSGMYHILAISGTHIGIWIFLMVLIFYMCGFPLWMTIASLIVLLSGAVVFFEWSGSILRAYMMFMVLWVSFVLGKKASLRTILWMSTLIILIIWPEYSMDIGFALSFIAVYSIMWALIWMNQWTQKRVTSNKWEKVFLILLKTGFISFCVVVGTAPLLSFLTGSIVWGGIIANMVCAPFVFTLMFFSIASACFLMSEMTWMIWTMSGGQEVFEMIFDVFIWIAYQFSSLPSIPIKLSFEGVIVVYSALFIMMVIVDKKIIQQGKNKHE